MSLAPYVQIVARGQGRARPLTQDEAFAAMQLMLSGDAAPEAIGALLMVLRIRGETPAEIAGFTAALRDKYPLSHQVDLDWPSYAAGRTRGAPLFLLAAKLVASACYQVALHGWNSHQKTGASVRDVLVDLDIPIGDQTAPISYFPVEDHAPAAFDLLRLRDVFGLRSCINTVLRMWNPANAGTMVQGVFHPSYRGLQAQAAELINQPNLTVIKGGGGEFERNPAKGIQVFGLRNGVHFHEDGRPLCLETRKLHEPDAPIDIVGLWHGTVIDEFAATTVIGTAALALWSLGAKENLKAAEALAANLWLQRAETLRKSA